MKDKKGPLLVFIAAVLFSMGGLLIKKIPWQAIPLNGARCLISVCVLGTYMLLTHQKLVVNKGVFLGAFCSFGTNILYTIANKMTTAANTIVLQFTAPVFIILFMWMFYREKPKGRDLITCAAVFIGILFFFLDSMEAGNMVGNILALISGATYAGVFMMNKFDGASPISSVFFGHSISAVIGFPSLLRQTDFSGTVVTGILVLGVFQMAIAYICLTKGLLTTPPVTASLVSGIEPVLNPILVAVFYHEYISTLSIIGAVIVIGSILLYNVVSSRAENAENPAN